MRRPSLIDLPLPPELPPGLTLRPYRSGDDVSLARLLGRAFGDEIWTVDHVHTALIDASDVEQTYVIAKALAIIATASARLLPEKFPGSGYLHWVASDPDYRRMHLGKIVVLAVLSEFARQGHGDCVLETETFRIPAIKLYKSLGFEIDEPALIDHVQT